MQQLHVRRYHKKSKSGCGQCRLRRVKCDETHPICANCLRACLKCNYYLLQKSASQSSLKSTNPSAGSSFSQPLRNCEIQQPVFDLLDLFLMNHFSSVTSLGLFGGSEHKSLWQREVPANARSSPMLMHAILSISALHLALLEPLERATYWPRALYHHNLGLQLFNSQIKQLSTENIHPAFTFSLVLVIWVYGSATMASEPMGLDDILDLLEIVRGCKTVFNLYKNDILTQMIGQIIVVPTQLSDCQRSSPAVCQALEQLRIRTVDSAHVSAVQQLHYMLKKTTRGDAKPAMAWPTHVDDVFWAQIRNHDPIATLIFGHYAILLRHYDYRYWWMKGWSTRIMHAVEGILADSDKALLVTALHSVDTT